MLTQNLGYPRIGCRRQLKKASENYWAGKISQDELNETARKIRCIRLQSQTMVSLLTKAADLLPAQNLWVNPDCGLKTRKWPETKAALINMVAAAKEAREIISLAGTV